SDSALSSCATRDRPAIQNRFFMVDFSIWRQARTGWQGIAWGIKEAANEGAAEGDHPNRAKERTSIDGQRVPRREALRCHRTSVRAGKGWKNTAPGDGFLPDG